MAAGMSHGGRSARKLIDGRAAAGFRAAAETQRPSDLKHVSLEMPSSSVSLRRRLLAPFLSPFLDGKGFVANVINYIAGFIFSTIKPMPR